MADVMGQESPVTPSHTATTNGHGTDHVFSPDDDSDAASQTHRHRFSSRFDLGPLDLSSTSSPSQLKRTIEAHLQETDRRLQDTQQLGTSLVRQREELARKLEEVEQFQDEAQIPTDLRRRLADIEKEHADVSREVARALIGPKAKPDESQLSESGVLTSQATGSPTKISAPSRRHRNQPSTRAGDLQFAADISTSLLAQVRQLQATVAERDETIKRSQAEREAMEHDLLAYAQKIRALDESEQKYKDENWYLETQKHDLLNAAKDAHDKEKKLHASLTAALADKTKLQNDLDELRMNHSKLSEEHTAARKAHDTEIHGLKRTADLADTERQSLQDRIDDLISQNQELAKAISNRSRSRQLSPGDDFISSREEGNERVDTPDDSPPPSPTKATPRHGGLESETLRSSLHHAHKMIQNLKGNIHREKTEKIELRRMLQEARDELESRRGDGGSAAKRQKSKIEVFKKPARPEMLGGSRRPRTDIDLTDDDWEDHNIDSPSHSRPVNTFQTTRPNDQRMSDFSDAYQTANDTEGNFDTADERNTTESEAFMTGVESLAGDSTDELTETEDTASRTGRPVSGRVGRSSTARKPANDRTSHMSSASSADEADVQTPMQTSFTRFKLRNSRASYRQGALAQESTPESLRSQPMAQDSPATVTQSPALGGQSLFAELGGMDELNSETHSTPARSTTMSSTQSTPAFLSTPSKSAHIEPPSSPIPMMVDSSTMTDPWSVQETVLLPPVFPLPSSASASPDRSTDNGTQYTPQRGADESPLRPASSHITPPKTVWDAAHEPTTPARDNEGRSMPQMGYSGVLSQDSLPVQSPVDNTVALQKQLEQLRADVVDKEKEVDELHASHAAALAAAAAELEILRKTHTAAINDKELENESLRSEHAKALSEAQERIQNLHDEHAAAIAAKELELEQLRNSHASDLAEKEAQLRDLQSDHAAALADKDAHLKDLGTSHDVLIAEKEAQLRDLQSDHAAALADKDAQLKDLGASHDVLIAENEARLRDLQSDHAAALADKDAQLKDLSTRHDGLIAEKEAQLSDLRSSHAAVLADRDAQIQNIRSCHSADIADKEAELARVHGEHLAALRGKESELESLRNDHAIQITGKNAELQALRDAHGTALSVRQAEIDDLRSSHAAERESLNKSILGHKEELSSMQQELDALRTSLNVALASKVSELESLRSSHAATLDRLNADMTAQLEDLNKKGTELEDLRKVHEEELEKLRSQISGHSEELGTRDTELEKLQAVHEAELASLRRQLAGQSEELSNKMQELEKLRSAHEKELDKTSTDAAAHLQELNAKQAELQALQESHLAEVQRLNAQISSGSQDLNLKQTELETLRATHAHEADALRTQVDTYTQKLNATEAELASALIVHEQEKNKLNQQIAEHLRNIESKEAEFASSKATQAEEADRLRAQVASQHQESAHKQSQLDKAQSEHVKELETVRNAQAEAVKLLEGQVATSEDRLKGMQSELETVRNTQVEAVKLLEEQISAREDRLKVMQSELETVRNTQAEAVKLLEGQIAAREDRLKVMQSELETVRNAQAEAAKLLEEQIAAREERLKGMQSKLDLTRSAHAQELDRLKAQISESDTLVAHLRNSHAQELHELQSQVHTQHAELESLRAALKAAEAQKSLPLASGYSSIFSQETQPRDRATSRSDSPERPRTAERIVAGGMLASAASTLETAAGRKEQPTRIREDDTAGPTNAQRDIPDTASSPLKEISGNANPRAFPSADVFGGMLAKPTISHDQGSQTMLTADQLDHALRPKKIVAPVAIPARNRSPGARTPTSPTRFPGGSGSRTRDVSTIMEDANTALPSSPLHRPSSASSYRTSSLVSQNHPPLPSDHKDIIARANSQIGSPTRQGSRQAGAMGPPAMPASATRRPKTPSESIRTASRVSQNGKRGTVGSQVSRRSSVSSFASELDERFNIRADQLAESHEFEAGPSTDPRMIQAITQTMIGEFLWKYTRKAGSKEMSTTRHRRYFWVHPYTKTLYWSDQDPQTAGRNELKAKSVQIESVRVVSDDNPMPPGLHRKSLEVITPGRKVKFTASTGQRHETWFNALSYLLHRSGDADAGAYPSDSPEITKDDIAEFGVNGYGARLVPNDSRMSMSSYNSRTTSGTTRRVGRQSNPIGTVVGSSSSQTPQTGISQTNDTIRQSRLEAPQVTDKDRTIRASSITRISRMFGSMTSRTKTENPATVGDASSQNRDNSSIYDASVVSDGRKEEEEEARRLRQQNEKPGLEDVRACCDGKHNVGSLAHRSSATGSSAHNRLSNAINRSMSRRA